MKVIVFIVFFSLTTTNVLAYKHLKTSNFDLRNNKQLLSIKDYQGSTKVIYKSVGDEYFYESQDKKHIDRFKISDLDAEKFDQFFVSQFINLKYSLPPYKGKNCSKSYTLSMRGETLKICKSETDKLKLMENILEKINSFKK